MQHCGVVGGLRGGGGEEILSEFVTLLSAINLALTMLRYKWQGLGIHVRRIK